MSGLWEDISDSDCDGEGLEVGEASRSSPAGLHNANDGVRDGLGTS